MHLNHVGFFWGGIVPVSGGWLAHRAHGSGALRKSCEKGTKQRQCPKAYEVIQIGMAVEAGAGRDEANPADTRLHKIKKEAEVENGAYGQEKLENNELCRSSRS